jgi:ABC-type lipoprotein export system ATPase subunit
LSLRAHCAASTSILVDSHIYLDPQQHIHTLHHGVKEEGSPQGTTASRKCSGPYIDTKQVIILGDSGVGKTSLMNQYVRPPQHTSSSCACVHPE